MQYNTMGRTLAELIPDQTRSLFETSLFSVFGQSLSTREHSRTYREMLGRALAAATDPAYGFTPGPPTHPARAARLQPAHRPL